MQNINIEHRESIHITGVTDVRGFDDTFVDVETELGRLVLRGEGFKISALSLEKNELSLTGFFYGCDYEDRSDKKGKSVIKRLL